MHLSGLILPANSSIRLLSTYQTKIKVRNYCKKGRVGSKLLGLLVKNDKT